MSSILYNDKLYGGATTALDADHVLYDNTDSGLTSSNVQDVVDELDEVIESLENPTFTEASTRANIASGESLATIFGKVKKVITDLEAVAFSGAADDVSYDNTSSDLTSSNVQGAIDELSNDVNNLIINSADGSIASFDDGAGGIPVRELKVQMEPIQDLHGYDHPWPAGGGKNLLPMTVSGIKAANMSGTWNGNVYTINGITFTVHANVDGSVTDITANGTATANANLYLLDNINSNEYPFAGMILSGGVSESEYVRIELEPSPWTAYATSGTAEQTINSAVSQQGTNKILTFLRVLSGYTSSNSVFKPMIRLASVSDATFAPYSNICPISGRTGVTVTRTGVNIWDEEWESGYCMDSNGEVALLSNSFVSKNYIHCFPSTSYYFKNTNNVCFYDESKNFINRVFVGTRNYTTPSNAHYMKFDNRSTSTYNHDICINYPSTDHDYHEGHVQTVEIPLGQTVYGGTLDVTQGVLTVDRALVDLGTFNWNRNHNDIGGYYYFRSGTFLNWKNGSYPNFICSQYSNAVSRLDMNDKTIAPYTSTTYDEIFVRDDSHTDAATFKSAMSGVQFVYELATPQTYQLTPQQVTTLLGQNNVWSDADSISLEYATNNYVWDTLHKIDTNIQNLEANDIAYDNTDSGLTATNVQDAVDEVGASVNDLNSAIKYTITSTNSNVTVNSGGVWRISTHSNVCIVSLKITLSTSISASTKILTGFPVNDTDGIVFLIAGLGGTKSGRTSAEDFYTNEQLSSGEWWITGAYHTHTP